MAKEDVGRFQLTLDTDSVFISPAPDSKKSRVVLSNLDQLALEQLTKSLIDTTELGEHFLNYLAEKIYTDPVKRQLYTLYMGSDSGLTDQLKNEIKECIAHLVDSYTLSMATGYFKGNQETAILIQIAVQNDHIAYQCADALRKKFGQEAIGMLIEGDYQRVINK